MYKTSPGFLPVCDANCRCLSIDCELRLATQAALPSEHRTETKWNSMAFLPMNYEVSGGHVKKWNAEDRKPHTNIKAHLRPLDQRLPREIQSRFTWSLESVATEEEASLKLKMKSSHWSWVKGLALRSLSVAQRRKRLQQIRTQMGPANLLHTWRHTPLWFFCFLSPRRCHYCATHTRLTWGWGWKLGLNACC